MNISRISLFLISLFYSVTLLANDNGYKSHGTIDKWYVFSKKSKELCYMLAEPDKSIGKYKLRGRVRVLVAHRPDAEIKNSVMLEFGYSFPENAKALIEIDQKKSFKLDTHEQTAWITSKSSKRDDQVIKEMIKGTTLKAVGKSKKGTVTTDFYALKGFSKAFKKIKDICG